MKENDPIITEDDLVRIFSSGKNKEKAVTKIWLSFNRLLLFVLAAFAIYLLINFGAIKSKLLYWYTSDFKAEQYGEEPTAAVPTAEAEEQFSEPIPVVSENWIKIPSLKIDAPITWRVNNTAREVSVGLGNGVIQLNGTALPGEIGNIYITGHSSNFVWAKGSYNNVFALINQLVAGDRVFLKFNNKTFVYEVTDQKVVLADDISVLQSSSESKLTLVTCWPVGTSLKRMVVTAKQIFPNPSKNVPPKNLMNFEQLPAGR